MSVQAPTSTLVRNGWRQAVASLRNRGGWRPSLIAFAAMLFLLQGLLLFAFSVSGVNALLLERAGLHLEVLPSATDQDIQELYADLQAMPEVTNATYLPKEKAYEQEKIADPELVAFLEQYNLSNPFPDSFLVTLKGPSSYPVFLQAVQQEKYRTVLDPSFLTAVSEQERDVQEILQMTSAFQWSSFALAFVAILVLCAMMSQYAARTVEGRREEFVLLDALGAAQTSLAAVLASELTLLLLMGFAIALVLTVACVSFFPLLASGFGAGDVYAQFLSALHPFLLTALPIAVLGQVVLFPLLAWSMASARVRKNIARPS